MRANRPSFVLAAQAGSAQTLVGRTQQRRSQFVAQLTKLKQLCLMMPQAEAVQSDLLRIALPTPTLPPATTTNHYVVGWQRAVLVDPATPERASQLKLVALLRELQTQGLNLAAIFLTHHHHDHAGAANDFARLLQLPIWAHEKTAELLLGSVKIDKAIANGEQVALGHDNELWIATHTPGHAPGHLVLQQQITRAMVAGDMVAGQGTILIDPRDGNMGQYLNSLALMAELQPSLLAPAHGPVLPDAQAVLAHYRAHRLMREAKILDALPQNWCQLDALLPQAYGDTSRLAWPLALRAMESHSLHLAERNLVERDGPRWRRIGSAAASSGARSGTSI